MLLLMLFVVVVIVVVIVVIVVIVVDKTKKSVNLLTPPAIDKGWISRHRKLCEAGSASFVNTASAQKVGSDEVGGRPTPSFVLVPQHIHCQQCSHVLSG